MPTAGLKVQGDGTFIGYTSIVGAASAFEAIDDSDGTTQDGDATYILFGNPQASGRIVSFRMFEMAEHLVPTRVVLSISAKTIDGDPEIFIGFTRSGVQSFHGTSYMPTGSYTPVIARTFNANPFNGQPWTESALVGLEPCLMMTDFVFASARITLLSAQVTYVDPHSHSGTSPRSGKVS